MTSSPRLAPLKHGGNAGSDLMARDAWVEIDLNRLEFNLQIIRAHIEEQSQQIKNKPPQIMGVVKADAYGHGAIKVAEVLAACGVNWLGVASADEGSELRRNNCKLPILILGPTPFWAVKKAIEQNLDLTISSLYQLQEMTDVLKDHKQPLSVHLKVDTGMHRLGMNIEDAQKAAVLLRQNKKFKLVSVYSHLAKSADNKITEAQRKELDRFIEIFKKEQFLSLFFHLAASEAAHNFPSTYYDMVRIGIEMYGLEANIVSPALLPVMAVRGRINQINHINEGESVGYGLTWKAARPTCLANIPIGYADGVDRGLSNKFKGLLHHQLVNQVGTISMDQMLFDITDVPTAKEGDVITLIGSDDYGVIAETKKSLPAETLYLADWAKSLDTITYELACRLKARLPRVYTRQQMDNNLKNSPLFTKSEKDK